MNNKFDIKLQLVILSINLEDNTQYVLSTNSDEIELPSDMVVKNEPVLDIVYRMCKFFINLTPTWVDPHLNDVYIEDDRCIITYGGVVPYNTELLNGACFLPVPVNNQIITGVVQRYGFIW